MNYKKDILEKRLNDFLSSDSFNKEMDDDDLHCEVFNSQDFISDRNEAIEFLGNKTFDILDFVHNWNDVNGLPEDQKYNLLVNKKYFFCFTCLFSMDFFS